MVTSAITSSVARRAAATTVTITPLAGGAVAPCVVPLVPTVARGWTAAAAVAVIAPIPLPLPPPIPIPVPTPVPFPFSVPFPVPVPYPVPVSMSPVTFAVRRAAVRLGLGRRVAALFRGIAADQGGALLGGILAILL